MLITSPVFANSYQPYFQRTITGPTETGAFNNPAGLDAYGTDAASIRLFVTDTTNNRIIVLGSTGNYITHFGASFGSGDSLNAPRGVAADATHNTVFVADTMNHRIVKFTKDADPAVTYSYTSAVGTKGVSGTSCDTTSHVIEFNRPYDLSVDVAGNRLYVADTYNHRVAVLDLDLNLVANCWRNTGVSGTDDAHFNEPRGIAAADAGAAVYVVDTLNSRIVKLNASTGDQISKFGTNGAGVTKGSFNNPSGIAVDASGFVYVADTANHAVHKLSFATTSPFAGTDLAVWGGATTYNNPYAVTALIENQIYVADTMNNRIQAYEPELPPTTVSLSTTTTDEISVPGTTIATLSAVDPNLQNTTFTFTLQTQTGCDSTDNTYFTISGTSLKAKNNLDYETKPTYNICVRASDGVGSAYGGPGYKYTSFAITLNNISDAPTLIVNGATGDAISLDEYTADGRFTMPGDKLGGSSSVPSLTVYDNDTGDDMTFELIGGTFANAFTLTKQSSLTADLTVKNCVGAGCDAYKTLLNFEAYPAGSAHGTLILKVTDLDALPKTPDHPNTATVTLTVNLADKNDPPEVTMPVTPFAIDENSPNNLQFGDQITVSDVDVPANTLSLAFNPASSYLKVYKNSANVFHVSTNSTPIDFETNPTFDLILRASDAKGGYASTPIHITVNDKNDCPVIVTTYSLHDSTPIGTVLNLASTPDAGDSHTFTIEDQHGAGKFAVNGSGQIILASAVTYPASYVLDISVQDHRTDPACGAVYGTVTINITQGNRAPVFVTSPAPVLTVPENTTSDTFEVGRISATDADGDPLTFATDTSNPNNPFKITTSGNQGIVTVDPARSSLLNYEVATSYSLAVTVSDGTAAPVPGTFTVAITNVNEQVSITNKTLTITKGDHTALNSVIGTIQWDDVDGKANTTPTFDLTVDGTDQFGINSDGEVYILPTASLHYYLKSSYTPKITITDKAGLDGTSDFFYLPITLTDDNDPPTFNNPASPLTLQENTPDGTLVGTFTVFDENGDDFDLSINGGNGAYGITVVNTTTAVQNGVTIITKTVEIRIADTTKIDYDTAPDHKNFLTILGTDDASSPLSRTHTYEISLTNVNEAPNVDDQTLTTYQNAQGGVLVGTIAAADPDEGTVLTYLIDHAGTGSPLFELDPSSSTSGKVMVKIGVEQYVVPGSYTLFVKVRDNATPALESRVATITITVTSKADPAVKTVTLPAADLLIGSSTQYNVTVGNEGLAASSPYSLDLKLPANVGFVVTGSTSGCTMKNADTVTCPAAALAPKGSAGDTASFVINAYISSSVLNGASLTATASLVLANPINDLNGPNNTMTVSFTARKSIVITNQTFESGSATDLTKNGTPFPTATTAPSCGQTNQQKFAGLFVNDELAYTKNVISHSTVEVTFNLYTIYSWDGNNPTLGGPDEWKFCTGDCSAPADILLDTSFSTNTELNDTTPLYPQSYPDSLSSGQDHPAMYRSAEQNTLGYHMDPNIECGGIEMNAVYSLSFKFDHTDPTLILKFIGAALQEGLREEKWGIDNLKVTIYGENSFEMFLPALRR